MVMAGSFNDHTESVSFVNQNVFIKKHVYLNDIHHVVEKGPKELIGDAFRHRVENIDHEGCEPGDEDTFFVADLGEVYRQHLRWKLNLPRVKPFYGE